MKKHALRPLTPKRKRFVAEYLIDHNGTQAAIRAGYSRNCAAHSASALLRNKAVARAVADAQAELADRMGITKERIIAELARIGFSDHPRSCAMAIRCNGD
jgi:phage terminase small subunit